MVAVRESTGLANDLEALATALDALELDPETPPGAEKTRLVRTIRSYLIPRLMAPGKPLTVVFAGPTGSGKSTLVNTLAGVEVSATGPIRPTTTEPFVLASKRFSAEMASIGDTTCHVVTGTAPILDRVSLVDTPDIDSMARDHRVTAEMLIDHADVVVFITSALRYADAVPWEVLRRARSRGAPLLFVLNRVSPESSGAYLDFTKRLREAGLDEEVLRVPEHHLQEMAHSIPALAVRELRRLLEALARDNLAKGQEILDRVLTATITQTSDLISEVDDLAATVEMDAESVRIIFSDRFAGLHLSRCAPARPVPSPKGRGRWWSWRWRRANRITPAEAAEIGRATAETLAALVESDIGRAAVASGAIPATVMSAARPVVNEAVSGWLDGLGSVIERVPARDRALGLLTLLHLVLGRTCEEAGRIFFGIDREWIAGDALATLRERLDVAYVFAAGIGTSAGSEADLDTKIPADRLAAVVVRSHFADA